MGVSKRVVAVIDWNDSSSLKENKRFFQTASDAGKVRPLEWREGAVNYRSLVLWDDGSCELQRLSTVAVARRLGWSIVERAARKTRMGQRG